jgi:hypothetical protein
MNMKKNALLLVLIFTVSLLASDFKKNGTAGYTFLELPATARTAALGECSVSIPDLNSSAVFSNPAALGLSNQTASFSTYYAPWVAEIKNYGMSAAYSTSLGNFGIGVVGLDYGSMPRTKKLSDQRVYEQDGTFDAGSYAIGLSYSRALTEKFSFGLTAKYVDEKIDVYDAANIIVDAGMFYYTGFRNLRIGAVLQNFGTDAKFINASFKMPAELRIGIADELIQNDNNRLTAMVEFLHPTDSDEKLNVGAEYEFMNFLVLRGGYKFFYDEETWSCGVGLKKIGNFPVAVDVSVSDYGRLGNIVRFTFQMGVL